MKFRKYFKWVRILYIILALFIIAAGLPNLLTRSAAINTLKDLGVKDLTAADPQISLAVIYGVEALVYLWLAWLAGRIVRDKSQGVFLALLVLISIISAAFAVFRGMQVRNLFNLVFNIVIMLLLIGVWVTD